MRVAALALAAAVLAGCSTVRPPESLDERGEPDTYRPINVALQAGDATRVDQLYYTGDDRPHFFGFLTGDRFERTFTGGADAPAVLHIDDAKLERQIIGAGFGARVTYSVKMTLRTGGQEYPLSAEGSDVTFALNFIGTIRNAVDQAVQSAAEKATAIVQKPPRAEPASVPERLRALTQLLRDGLITQEEFEAKRKQLLDSL